ncbi:hypothetical protein GCM10022393_13210 [Aquimarina addita]|uniref:Uncharacterized protein n=1 Tax=Aquimarina addita TaxID=870485 RepID=A0ABP7XFF6_9FLAO
MNFIKNRKLEKIVDKYLDEIVSLEINSLPIRIEPEMAEKNSDKNQEWNNWFPIQSTITDIGLNFYIIMTCLS